MKLRAIVASVTFCLSSMAFCQPLRNGDFEAVGPGNAPSGWNVESGKLTCDSVKKHSGTCAGKLDGASGPSAAYQDVQVHPGGTYILAGVWRNGDHTAAFDVARANVRWLTEPGGKDISNAGMVDSGATVASWNRFQLGPLKVPQAARGARIRLSSSFGICAFDDLEWKTADPSTAAMSSQSGGATPAGGGPKPDEPKQNAWLSSIQDGQQAARSTSKKILVFFSAKNNGASDYFEKNVFSDPGIQSVLNLEYVRVKLDTDENAALASDLKVKHPGVILIFDRSGQGVDRIEERLPVAVIEKRLLEH